jgi:hypothetical protein
MNETHDIRHPMKKQAREHVQVTRPTTHVPSIIHFIALAPHFTQDQ